MSVVVALSALAVEPGFCQCRCGQSAPIAKKTDRRKGHVKGQPTRFVSGHNQWPWRHLAERFWAKVDRSGGPAACWPWMGYRDPDGYGQIRTGDRMVLAHRVAWILTSGPIPPDKPEIRHVVCRNPACCNPAHLEPGTHADNEHDKVADGTDNRGERHGMAKMNEATVHEIRRLHADEGLSPSVLARRFGVARQTISNILAGRRWSWLEERAS